jgi:hypothetical protein
MQVTKDDVIASVRSAWANAVYPGDDKVRGGDDGTDIAADFAGRRWEDIPPAVLRSHALLSNLLFMTPEALHFYLPAFVIAALSDDQVTDSVISTLTHPRSMTFNDLPLRLLTEAQRNAIGLLWAYFRERPDLLASYDLEDGLETWAPYVPLRRNDHSR